MRNNLAIVNHFPWPICQFTLTNSEQIGFSEQLCDDQKVPYYQVWLYIGHPLIGSSKKHAKTERPKWVEIISEGAFLFFKTGSDKTIYWLCRYLFPLQLFKNEKKKFCEDLKVNWKKKAPSEMSSPHREGFYRGPLHSRRSSLMFANLPPESKAQ